MAQTIRDLYAAKAGAGKPVSASKVSGGTSIENKKKKTLSELAAEAYSRAAGSGTDNPPAAGGGSPLYTRGPSTMNSKKTLSQLAAEQAAKAGSGQSPTASRSPLYTRGPSATEETKPKTISELYRAQAAQGYSRPVSGPAVPAYTYAQPETEDPIDAAIRRQKEIAEQYARAEREYKAAQADMQMMAMSGGLVSADAAAREQAAREAYQRAQAEYTQSREKAPDERQSWREAAQRQREAQAELELAAMSGGYAGADAAQRAVQAAQERENARQAYLTQRNQNIAQGDGTNAARGRDSLFRGAYDLADNRESSLPGSEYAALMGREDFAALSQAGESKLSWNPFRSDARYDYINDINGARQIQDAQTMADGGRSYAKYALMTDQEIAVYNYLYASGGKKAADAFLKDLEPELDKQWYSGVSRQVTDWAEKDEVTKAVASAATVAGKPVRDLTSLLATGEDAIRWATGQGINPYSELRTASRMTQDIRGAVSQDMGEVGQFAYNTAMSAADSAVGSFVASGIAQGIGAADVTKATATISSALMSSEVASLATAEAKEKGYSDLGALGLGLFRGAVEFASEKIGGEWVIRNMKKDPLNFMKTMLMNFIPEGTEEVMSDAANEAANLFIDWIFDTDESMIRQTYKYFSEKGTAEQKADPWLWTAMAMLKQEGLAFLGGGFATVGSTGAQYMNMQQSFRSAAEQLHTDNRTVAQLMEELGAEDPAAVAGMAEISKAESVEDFRAKMQTLDLAAEEADAAMQGKKGKKKKAREPRTLGDLAKAWMEKYPDGSVPAPFAGMEETVMGEREERPAPEEESRTEDTAEKESRVEERAEPVKEKTYGQLRQQMESDITSLTDDELALLEDRLQASAKMADTMGSMPGRTAKNTENTAAAELAAVRAEIQRRQGRRETGGLLSQNDGTGENGTGAEAVNTNGSEADLSQNKPTAENGTTQTEGIDRGSAADNLRYFNDDADDAEDYFRHRKSGESNIYEKQYHGWTWYVQEKSDGTYTAYAADSSKKNGAFIANETVGEGYASAREAAEAAMGYVYDHESEEDWNHWTNSRPRKVAGGSAESVSTDAGDPQKAGLERTKPEKPVKTAIQLDPDIEQENIEDGKEAVRKLMADAQTSDDPAGLVSKNAMYRSDIGHIDFRYGTPGKGPKFKGGFGLAHIIAKRNAENGRGLEIVDNIIEAIAKAESTDRQYTNNQSDGHYRMRLYYGDITVVLNKDPGENHWLLTGWENNKTAATATGEVHDSTDATAVTPTRTRRNGDATVSKDSIRNSSEKSNPQNEGRASAEVPAGEEENRRIDDASYRNAVQSGNTQKAQQMVDRAAKQAGYSVTAYHGGTRMNHSAYNGTVWFTDSLEAASTYANDSKEILSPKDGGEKRSGIYRAALNLGKNLEIDARGSAHDNIKPWNAIPELRELRGKEGGQEYWDALEWFERELALDRETLSEGITTDSIVEYAKKKGYDSVTFRNVVDEHYSEEGAKRYYQTKPGTVYAVFDGSRFKSTAPVEYDDQGGIIPLSERFKGRGDPSATPQNDRRTKGETVQQEFDRLSQEIQEEGHDAEYYQSRGRRLNELMEQGAKVGGTGERIAAPPAEARNDRKQQERRKENASTADALAEGKFKGIDIMPGEGEEAISSAAGLTEEDQRAIDMTLALVGETSEKRERAATQKAAKEGNAALAKFAEEMPDDPMDLYQEQNPVSARKGGGDDGGEGYHAGQEKISTSKEGEKKTLWQRISDAWTKFLRNWENEGVAIHQVARKTGNRAIDGMYFYAKAATMRAQQWIQKQRTSFDTQTTGKSLNAIFDPIRAKGDKYYEQFQLCLYHMLNVERMSRSTADILQEAQRTVNRLAAVNPDIAAMTDETLAAKARQYQEGGGLGYEEENGELIYEYWKAKQELKRAERARNKPVFGYDMDAEESRKIAGDLLAAHPEFEQMVREVYDYTDALLQYRVDAGLITAEDMTKLMETYPHYVPVMYEMTEEEDEKVRKGNVTVSTAIGKAKGGSQRLLPLHYALARQTLAVMRNAGYQQLGSEILNEYQNNGEIMSQYVTNMEESDAVWDESLADNDDVAEPYENVISVFKNGKRYDLTLSDDMSFAFQSLQGKNGLKDVKPAMAANNLFKKLCTAYNPLFMITNPIRDVQDALFYSTDTKRWLKNYPKAIAQIAGGGKYWQMYQSLGGVQNSYFDWATGETAKKMGKFEALNMAIEQMPRLAEFMTVLENAERKNGKITQADRMEAFNAAAEITTNFSRGGTMGKWVNRNLVPFWNPGVQGLSKAVRTVTETKSFKSWAMLALKAAALGMLPELLNGLLYRDDDEWDVIDDQMKLDYYLFKTSDGVWIKVPKGRVLAALSMPVVGAQETLRGDDVDWGELGKAAFGSVAPNNPFETNIFSTAMQAKLFNPDDPGKTWYGSNIESRRLQSYAPGERYDESTDIISKWLGGKLNISPKKISYVIDQYSGILGDLILPYLTPKAERGVYIGDVAVPLSNAFMSRFTTDTVTSNTIADEYYGLLDQLGFDAKGGDQPSKIAERYMNRAGGKITEMYAQIREIENDPNLTDREKSQLTRELRKQLNAYEQEITAEAGKYLADAQSYLDGHPEVDFTDDKAVEAWTEGYNAQQTSEKYQIDTDTAADKMKDEAYREINREHFGAEYALQAYSKDVYAKAQGLHEESGLSYDDYYDYYFDTRYMYADKDENGKSISGSKKEKVVGYIDGMDITDEQKDALFLAAGYDEKTLGSTPWHGGNGIYTKNGGKRSGGRSGGGRSRSRSGGRSRSKSGGRSSGAVTPAVVKAAAKGSTTRGTDYGIEMTRALFGGSSAGSGKKNSADATGDIVKIVDRYYNGNMLLALADGGRKIKGRTTVDFEL